MLDDPRHDRSNFLGAAALCLTTQFAGIESASAQTRADGADVTKPPPLARTSFDSLKQVNAGVLNIGYAEAGPGDGPAVVLLHGWPYDIHSFVEVRCRRIGHNVPQEAPKEFVQAIFAVDGR